MRRMVRELQDLRLQNGDMHSAVFEDDHGMLEVCLEAYPWEGYVLITSNSDIKALRDWLVDFCEAWEIV